MGKELLTILSGIVQILLPRRVLAVAGKVLLAGYENPEDLKPKEWYVKAVRVQGLVTVLVGLLGLAKKKKQARGGAEKDEAEA
ncbi:hypothetical protein [Halosegnis longus]|uniref:DUF6199 domain-containing protein n=1 Tax=Halosegnis longus TaxID=2216012 RepID=A0AAJ4R8K8_9EURY|nr:MULTISPECIES: hypothetical protein [Halobacteriales]RNJ26220.1 hypothetical protein Nmn1133_05710 [Salella cibi]